MNLFSRLLFASLMVSVAGFSQQNDSSDDDREKGLRKISGPTSHPKIEPINIEIPEINIAPVIVNIPEIVIPAIDMNIPHIAIAPIDIHIPEIVIEPLDIDMPEIHIDPIEINHIDLDVNDDDDTENNKAKGLKKIE